MTTCKLAWRGPPTLYRQVEESPQIYLQISDFKMGQQPWGAAKEVSNYIKPLQDRRLHSKLDLMFKLVYNPCYFPDDSWLYHTNHKCSRNSNSLQLLTMQMQSRPDHNRWMVRMGGAGKSGDGSRMVSRVSLKGLSICGQYGCNGLGCEWLAGLVWEGLGCEGLEFAYNCWNIGCSSDNGGGQVLGLLCVEWNGAGSNLAVHFNFFFPVEYFLSSGSSYNLR